MHFSEMIYHRYGTFYTSFDIPTLSGDVLSAVFGVSWTIQMSDITIEDVF